MKKFRSLSIIAALTMMWIHIGITALAVTPSLRRAFVFSLSNGACFLSLRPSPSHAGLLDDFGTDPTTITQRQTPPPPSNDIPANNGDKAASLIEPNSRSNYYYPTNKKRYLPSNCTMDQCADAFGAFQKQLVQAVAKAGCCSEPRRRWRVWRHRSRRIGPWGNLLGPDGGLSISHVPTLLLHLSCDI